MWDDVIGEPEGIRSTDCAWNCSYKCFRGTKNCCYILLATLFGPCLAFCSESGIGRILSTRALRSPRGKSAW